MGLMGREQRTSGEERIVAAMIALASVAMDEAPPWDEHTPPRALNLAGA